MARDNSSPRPRKPSKRVSSILRRLLTGGALVALGVSVGIIFGTVSNLPDLLYRRLREEPTTVDLRTDPVDPEKLEALGALQLPGPAVSSPAEPAPPPVARPARETAAAVPPAPAPRAAAPRPPTAPSRTPAVSAAPAPRPGSQPQSAAKVIDEIARKLESDTRANARSGPVVQVASYTDPRAAQALATRLRKGGFDSFVSVSRPAGQRRYRVRVWPSAARDEKALAGQLEARGFSVWITRQ
jgi:cell division septation protein DedD